MFIYVSFDLMFWIQKEKLLSLKVKQPAARKENTVWKIVFKKVSPVFSGLGQIGRLWRGIPQKVTSIYQLKRC